MMIIFFMRIRKIVVVSCACLIFMTTLSPEQLSAQESTEDYTSKVPQYTFSTTLEEQEAELKVNPLMMRLNASREKMASDIYRPIYHYVNPEGSLNDPNGLCFWKGNWHLFYQAYPPEDTRQHWGHAVSDDLVHWQDLPRSRWRREPTQSANWQIQAILRSASASATFA